MKKCGSYLPWDQARWNQELRSLNFRSSVHLQMEDGERPYGLQMVINGKILTVTMVVEVETAVRIGRLIIC